MIEIRRLTGQTETVVAAVSDANAEYGKALMGMDEVTLNLVCCAPLDLHIRDFIRFDGEVYSLNRNPEFTQASEVEYRYTLVFESPVYNLMDKLYKSKLQGESRFTLTGTLEDFVDLLLWNINQDEFDRGWEKSADKQGKVEITETEMKNLTFNSESCYEVLSKLANEFDVEYRVAGRRIAYKEKLENVRDLKFEQGCGNGLYTLIRQNVDTGNTVTRAYVYGSTENLLADYRGGGHDRLLPADEKGEVIPHFDNTVDYDKIVERDVFFDDVKPSFTGGIETVRGENNKVFTCREIDFDLNDKMVAIGDLARVNFLTGDLMGIGFRFTYDHSGHEVTLLEQEDETALTTEGQPGVKVPNSLRKPSVGDKFNFTGIRLPASYVTAAEKRLAEKGRKWMEVYSKLRVKYNLDVDYRYLRDKGIKPDVGDVVRIGLPGGGEQQLRIISLRKQLATGQVTCEVSNYLPVSWEKQIEGKIQEARSSVELSKSEVLYSINATKEWVSRYFARLADRMADGQAIVWDEVLHVIRTAQQVPDAVLWDGLKVGDWLDQAVRTTDPVKFRQVVAEELIEQTEGSGEPSGGEVSALLVEYGAGDGGATTLGALENVDILADTAGQEDVVLFRAKDSDRWTLKLLSEIGGGETGIQRNVRIVNHLDNKNIAASKGEPCILKFTFISQERYGSAGAYEDTGERGLLQIGVRGGNQADYKVVKQMYINSAAPVEADVAEFLVSGANHVMLKVTGEITEVTTPAFVYTIQLTSLSLSADNFRWWTAYAGDITLPLNIGGNVAKTLYVTMTGKDYNESYRMALGSGVYIETAYNYILKHPGKTGVFQVSAYVSNSDGTIRTKTVTFQIICAVSGERMKLIAVNHVSDKATNWAENALFDYTMYDGDEISTSACFVVKKDTATLFTSEENNILTSTRYTFSFPMEVQTIDSAEFDITTHILSGDTLLCDPLTIPVDNSHGYPAMPGAVFYLSPRTRSNRQGNRLQVINEVDQSEIGCTWKGMNWGNDGWTTDAEANSVLRLMAGASLAIGYRPFKTEAARSGKTIEIDYKIDQVTDYTEPLLTIASEGALFSGLKIFAEEVVLFSQALKNRDNQGTYVRSGERIRLTLVIMPEAYGNPEFNLCILYIDGVKNREFTYENNDYFFNESPVVIGSDYADIDVYGIRVYDSALTSQGVLRNYINWLTSDKEKTKVEADNDVMDVNGSEVDFENTKDQFNVFVFNRSFPSLANPNKLKGSLEVYFAGHPEWNVTVGEVEAKGQGTSSMRYWKWNVRFTLDKNLSVVTASDGTTTTGGWAMTPGSAKATRITAKKNFASSMQSHKIGSVNSVDDLYRAMGYLNEAMQTEKYPNARVAVSQLPFVAFEKSVNEEGQAVYTFMGLYTMGPDKGDKNTFGYDTALFPGLIAIEGSDNSPLCTLFRVPWNSRMQYNDEEEAFQYNEANAWDFGAGDLANIDKWIPAYQMAYVCSDRLKPFRGTLAELNASLDAYRNEPYEFWIAQPGDMNRYNVYYYEAAEGKFMASDTGGGTINLVSQLADKGYGLVSADLTGKTDTELNALFIAARVQKFRQEAPQYWDIDDAILHCNWVEFHAGTDNRAKNTYPYCFGSAGSKWRWRYDDLDTIFDIDNQGQAKKGYSVEFHDRYETGGSVWNGETSNFWNLLDLAFPNEIVAGMRKMMQKMEDLGGLKSGTDFDKLYAYFQKYYFAQAQQYFPQNLYNADARYAYENAKLAYQGGQYTNDTDPMTQALGDHFSAEQRWIIKRILYMMSKYSFGIFSADGTDHITVRAAGNTIRYGLTPAIDLYPAIANGTSIVRGARTKAGETCEMLIELSGSGDQQNTIQGASYLEDIGDWHDKNVTGTMIIQGRMLREIRLGHKTADIVISVSSLTISNCASLQKLLLSRIHTLTGALNLTACTHLKEVHIDGTSLTQLRLPEGGGLELIEFNALAQYLVLKNYPLLTNEGVNIDECKANLTDFLISDCPRMQPMQLLADIMNAQSDQGDRHALKRIRAVGFEETYNSSEMLEKLSRLADGSYSGLSSEGIAGEDRLPVLDGVLIVNSDAYENDVETLRSTFKKLVLQITGRIYIRFTDLFVENICVAKWDKDQDGHLSKDEAASVTILDGTTFKGKNITTFEEFGRYFIHVNKMTNGCFENCTELKSICLPSQLNQIESNSFQYCSGLKYIELPDSVVLIGENVFGYCTNLEKVKLSASMTILEKGCFYQCSKLQLIEFPENLIEVADRCFTSCTSLKNIAIPGTVTKLGSDAFSGCISLTEITIPGSVKSVMGGMFSGCVSLSKIRFEDGVAPLAISGAYWIKNTLVKTLVLPSNTGTIGTYFVRDSVLETLYVRATTPPVLGRGWGDDYNKMDLYVPLGCRDAYVAATNWNLFKNIREYDFKNDPDQVL